uniref:Uncharacterized protein n=1 Tax=Ackermannviridae sp. TaxID=2831612 RepID=A0A8S5VKI2_9CAUD|nr:MAG TPA: hypothetical protein [Ackermannviridae sp.]
MMSAGKLAAESRKAGRPAGCWHQGRGGGLFFAADSEPRGWQGKAGYGVGGIPL